MRRSLSMTLVLLVLLLGPTTASFALPPFPVDLSSPVGHPQSAPLALDRLGKPLELGVMHFSLQFSGSYMPLEYREAHLTQIRVEHALGAAVGAAVGFGYADLGIVFPVAVNLAGQLEGRAWQATAVGDLTLVPRVSPLPADSGMLGLLLAVPITFPTGDEDSYAGRAGLTAEPQMVVSLHPGRVALVVRPGLRLQGGQKLTIPRFSNWMTLHTAVGVDLGPGRNVRPEIALRGVLPVQGAGNAAAEVLAGASLEPVHGLTISAHFGVGMGELPGVARARVMGQVSWDVGGGASTPGRSADIDGDGLLDTRDACPSVAEDLDGWDDGDGCPEPDNDGDGFPDSIDACPDHRGPTGVGCPPGTVHADLDEDQVVETDACPLQPEDHDGFEDGDGCPEPDNDRDRILDEHDACPDEPEDGRRPSPQDGCPRR